MPGSAVMTSAISLAPIALGAAGMAAALHERARDVAGAATLAIAACASLLLYPVALPVGVSASATVLAACFGGALWLAGRREDDARVTPIFFAVGAFLGGARPLVGAALLPFAVPALLDQARRQVQRGRDGLRPLVGAALVLGVAGAVGYAAFGRRVPAFAWHEEVPLAWLSAAARSIGPSALALAGAGLALAATSHSRRRPLACVAVLALFAEAASARSPSAIGAMALALGLGLCVIEAGVRLGTSSEVRGRFESRALLLVPLLLLALAEPVGARLSATHLTMPTFGPVPPHAPPASR
jgi:hypothetical protein